MCSCLQHDVAFLGQVVSGNGIAMQPDKVQAVSDWPTPRNFKVDAQNEYKEFYQKCKIRGQKGRGLNHVTYF